jgi:GntP family gluconate:H+ symporter
VLRVPRGHSRKKCKEDTPKAAASFLPLLLPAVMIAVGSIGKLRGERGKRCLHLFNTFGNTVLALFCGIIAVGMLIFGRKKKVWIRQMWTATAAR